MIRDHWLDQNLNDSTKTDLGYGKLEIGTTVYSEASPLTCETTQRHVPEGTKRESQISQIPVTHSQAILEREGRLRPTRKEKMKVQPLTIKYCNTTF